MPILSLSDLTDKENKMTIELLEVLNDLDFEYVINDDGSLSLKDMQEANLGNIESETFTVNDDIAMTLIDRLDNYIYDYYLNGYIDTLRHECGEDVKGSDFEDILEKMKMHPDKFEGCIDLMEAFINPSLFDVSEIIESSRITKKCFRCGTRLLKSPVEGYTYFCPNCYEDFYKFEQE